MKIFSIMIAVFIFVLPVVNLPISIYNAINYYEAETLTEEIQCNIDYFQTEEIMETYTKFYGNNVLPVFIALQDARFSAVSRSEAIRLLALKNVDAVGKNINSPIPPYSDIPEARLEKIQFFNLDGTDYFLCYYGIDTFLVRLYTFEKPTDFDTLLQKDCFDKGNFFSSLRSIYVKSSVYSVFVYYIPVYILTSVMLLPYLLFEKKVSSDSKKKLKKLAKISYCVIPLAIIFYCIYIYCS